LWKFVDIIGLFFYTHSPYFRKKSSPIHFPYDKVFVKYQAQGGGVNPKTHLAYALVSQQHFGESNWGFSFSMQFFEAVQLLKPKFLRLQLDYDH